VGEVVEVMVLSADKVRRRISLSLRQLHGGGPTEGGEDGGTYEPPAYQIPDDEDDSGVVAALDSEDTPGNGVAADGETQGDAGLASAIEVPDGVSVAGAQLAAGEGAAQGAGIVAIAPVIAAAEEPAGDETVDPAAPDETKDR